MFGLGLLAKIINKKKEKSAQQPPQPSLKHYKQCLNDTNERLNKIIEDYNKLVDGFTAQKHDMNTKEEVLNGIKDNIKTMLQDKQFDIQSFKKLCEEYTKLMEEFRAFELEVYSQEVEVNTRFSDNEQEINRLKMDIKFYTSKVQEFDSSKTKGVEDTPK